MCGGGGNAAQAAQQQEAQRQAGITNAVSQINGIYGSPARQQQYGDFQKAIQGYNLNQLNEQNKTANRNLNFSMARQGLTGGSADADAAAMQEHLYNQGVLKSEQSASQAAAALKQSDQQSKQQLIGLAESGLDATSAQAQGLASLQANIQNAMGQAETQNIGDAFGGLGDYFANSQKAAQMRQLYIDPSTYGLFGSMPQNPYGLGGLAIGAGSNITPQNYLQGGY